LTDTETLFLPLALLLAFSAASPVSQLHETGIQKGVFGA